MTESAPLKIEEPVYQGPGAVHRITSELAALTQRDGLAAVTDTVGVDAHTS